MDGETRIGVEDTRTINGEERVPKATVVFYKKHTHECAFLGGLAGAKTKHTCH